MLHFEPNTDKTNDPVDKVTKSIRDELEADIF